jgi:hypothetical protein
VTIDAGVAAGWEDLSERRAEGLRSPPSDDGRGDLRQTEALGGAVQLPLDLDRDQAGPVQHRGCAGPDERLAEEREAVLALQVPPARSGVRCSPPSYSTPTVYSG